MSTLRLRRECQGLRLGNAAARADLRLLTTRGLTVEINTYRRCTLAREGRRNRGADARAGTDYHSDPVSQAEWPFQAHDRCPF